MRPGGLPPGPPLRSRAPQTPREFMWSKRSGLLRQLDDLSGQGARLQGAVATFPVLPMHLWIIEQGSREGLSWRDFTHCFLICFEQRVDHGSHLPSNPPKDSLLATVV